MGCTHSKAPPLSYAGARSVMFPSGTSRLHARRRAGGMADLAENASQGGEQAAPAADAGEAASNAALSASQADAAVGDDVADEMLADGAALAAVAAEEEDDNDGDGDDQLSFDYSGDEMDDADEVRMVRCFS